MQTCPRCKLNTRRIPCGICGFGKHHWSIADYMTALAVVSCALAGALWLV